MTEVNVRALPMPRRTMATLEYTRELAGWRRIEHRRIPFEDVVLTRTPPRMGRGVRGLVCNALYDD